MKQQVLKTITKGDIQAARDEAQQQYLNRVEGFDVDYQGRPDASGNLPRRWFKGAVVEFVTSTGPDELLDIVLKKIGEGWARSTTATTSMGAAYFNVYLMKPAAQQQEDLKVLYVEAEVKLRAKVEVENEAIIEQQVQLRIANAARLKAEQLAKEAQEEAAAIREEVERALGATRAAVRASLGAK